MQVDNTAVFIVSVLDKIQFRSVSGVAVSGGGASVDR